MSMTLLESKEENKNGYCRGSQFPPPTGGQKREPKPGGVRHTVLSEK